jgi:hypothetical protein
MSTPRKIFQKFFCLGLTHHMIDCILDGCFCAGMPGPRSYFNIFAVFSLLDLRLVWFCRRGMMVSLALLSPNTALACIFSYVSLRVGRIIRSYVRHQECLITDQVLSSGADVDSMLPVGRGRIPCEPIS